MESTTVVTSTTPRERFGPLLEIALDLSASMTAEDRFHRVTDAVRRVLPCDATVLFARDGEALLPLAAHGLSADGMGRRWLIDEHPRLRIICESEQPTLFPADSPLPDPFDGLLACDSSARVEIHACLGFPLRIEGELIGVLTADAMEPDAFSAFDATFLEILAALAGAALRTSRLIDALERRAEHQGRVARTLQRDLEDRCGSAMIGRSSQLATLREEIDRVGRSGVNVLVTGESGVGKELAARMLHAASARSGEALIYVNCSALPESMAESELFGHERGAFTGAESRRAGRFEVADGGTLFLDEIGEMPLSIQPKLLRAVQDGEVQRVGADRPVHVDVRIIAATNRELEREVAAGRFRSDLYHRLNVYCLRVPALRERRDDIPILAGYFCDLARRRLGCGPIRMTQSAQRHLREQSWPGNVRELENQILRSVIQAGARVEGRRSEPVVLEKDDLVGGGGASIAVDEEAAENEVVAAAVAEGRPLRDAVEDFQRRLITASVKATEGNWAAAARRLGLHRSNLHNLAKRLGLR